MNSWQALKDQKIVSIREFSKNMSKITSSPTHKLYTIVKNGKEVGTFIPTKYEDEFLPPEAKEKPKKYNSLFDNYENMVIEGGDPDLSKKIDQILYGKK